MLPSTTNATQLQTIVAQLISAFSDNDRPKAPESFYYDDDETLDDLHWTEISYNTRHFGKQHRRREPQRKEKNH